MVLLGYNWLDVFFGILYVSLGLLVVVILYKRLLRYLGRNEPTKSEYCVLYGLEEQPSRGEVTFYFTANENKSFNLSIYDNNLQLIHVVKEGECTPGGNIIRFDSLMIPNADYFFVLQTDNQKTTKKMTVKNG